MRGIEIRKAVPSNATRLGELRHALWPESSADEHAREIYSILNGERVLTMPFVVFVAELDKTTIIGFLEADLRSHADGCDETRAVGFIEGWYVVDNYRRLGIGRRLVTAAEEWARSQGCTEMASDAWIDNEVSQQAHQAIGHEVVDRCVHFRKPL
jgi:aminoglycoside 6'-N-acetyltransferase I